MQMRRNNIYDKRVFVSVCNLNEYGLKEFNDPGINVIDIGAHIGSFSLACFCRGARNILAFEPNPDSFVICEENLQGTGAQVSHAAVVSSQLAASKQLKLRPGVANPGCSEMAYYGNHIEEHGDSTLLVTIESLIYELGRVHLLKIDAEGAEYDVLRSPLVVPDNVNEIVGEVHFFYPPKHPPAVYADYYSQGGPEELFDILHKRGYQVKFSRNGVGVARFWAGIENVNTNLINTAKVMSVNEQNVICT